MNKLRYSIIFGVLRPEISERISLGLIIIDGKEVNIRYSVKKLHALRGLFSKAEYEFVEKVLRTMSREKTIRTVEDISYLSRYSNNLLSLSQLQVIDLAPTKASKDWLFRNYVYAGSSA
ncbi:MAG: hypothetical protein J6W19_06525 [Prevotella sp.]|nr:hypothetical protein [Prevotella sp.]